MDIIQAIVGLQEYGIAVSYYEDTNQYSLENNDTRFSQEQIIAVAEALSGM